jgi:alkanesulfonate monooxygenase SsuD/methylene tetrahydromethanopterin reductase-like flavin-dependent oxidoreductase (luciferase family)
MKLGVFLRPVWSYEAMLDLAQHSEELGYDGVYLNDHVIGLMNEERMPFLEAMTTSAAIATETKRVRIGHIVIFNSLRNPAFLAKTLTTIDQISKGRLDVIIGTGWNAKEYEGYDLMNNGKGMPSGPRRVSMLVEAVQIMRGMFEHNDFSYHGKFWKLKNALNYPLPVQKPLKIQIGAVKPYLIKMAAQHADGLNIRADLETLTKDQQIYLKVLKRRGKDPEKFLYTGFEHTMIWCKDEAEYDALAKQQAQRGRTTPEYVKKNYFVGTTEALIEKLRSADELGLDMMVIYVRPASTLSEAKEKLSGFRDEVVKQL